MQDSDREAFAMALIAASEVYRQEVTQQAIALWWQTLEPYPLPAVQAAVAHHIKASRFMPTPADLLAIIEGSPQDKAEAAWQKVLKAAREHGQARSVAFDDPLIPACVLAMGGFARICMCNINDLQWLKKEWMPLYQTYSIRPPASLPRYLPGSHETGNKSAGYDTPAKVYLVGDQQQASTLLTQHELDTDSTHRLQAISSKAISALDHEPDGGEV
jgi:hypothetical protein